MTLPGSSAFSRWAGSLFALERISGPFRGGYYIAAYAVDSDDGYVGYAKICPRQLQDVWLAPAVGKVGTDIGYAESADALRAAEELAQLRIARHAGRAAGGTQKVTYW